MALVCGNVCSDTGMDADIGIRSEGGIDVNKVLEKYQSTIEGARWARQRGISRYQQYDRDRCIVDTAAEVERLEGKMTNMAELPPLKDLNELAARHIMGWHRSAGCGVACWVTEDGGYWGVCDKWRPMKNLAQALLVWAAMSERHGRHCEITAYEDGSAAIFFNEGKRSSYSGGLSLPLQPSKIVEACLKAVGAI